MSTFTTNLDLELVARGDDAGTWDTPTNANWSIVDTAVGTGFAATGLTPTYISSVSFSLAGNQTAVFPTSRRIKASVIAGTVYGSVIRSTAGSSSTVVTVTMDSTALDAGLFAVSAGMPTSLNNGIPAQFAYFASVRDPQFAGGAKGDGTTDDTAAMQAAHNTGRVVYYPAGTYNFTALSFSKGGILGESLGQTFLVTTALGSTDSISFTGNGTTSAPIFEKFCLLPSGGKSGGAGIKLVPSSCESSFASIRQVEINSFPIGISFVAANNWVVSQCKILNYTSEGIVVDNTNNPDSGDSLIEGNLINTAFPAVGIQQNASGGLKIIGNKFNGGAVGYQLSFNASSSPTGDLLFLGNSVENMTNEGMNLAVSSTVAAGFSNITITGNQFAINPNAVQIASSQISNITISGNVINTNFAGNAGITVINANNFSVVGNTLSGAGGGTGIFWSGATNGIITGNMPSNFTNRVSGQSSAVGVYVLNNPF